ncbi:MAG: protein translocase subunit SecF [Candidatus Paceibacterota bacterium]
MFSINHKKIFFTLSGLLVLFSIAAMFIWGLNPGIEFTGGAISEIRYEVTRPPISQVESALSELSLGSVRVQETGESGFIIRSQGLTEKNRETFFSTLSFQGEYTLHEERFSLVGPSVGEELRKKAWAAIILVLVGIILFVAFAFRGIARDEKAREETGVTAWHYGAVALVALAHDIIIPTGLFAFLGSIIISAQIDVLFVTALLAILGYSVNDTIVVFDRVRENVKRNYEERLKKPFDEIVGESLKQTYTRSINTSLTTLFVLLALFFIGGAVTQNFVLVLAIGVVVGTYSSIFLATPLLVALSKRNTHKKNTHEEK